MKTENFSLATSTAVQIFHTLTRVIRYDEGSGTGTPLIRVRSLNTGDLDVEMKPGKLIKLPAAVDGIVITNLTANPITGKITLGAGDVEDNNLSGTVTLDSASLAALESVDLNAATIDMLMVKSSGSYAVSTGGTAATSYQVIDPATNINGLWVTEANIFGYNSGAAQGITLLAKSSSPSSRQDGEVILNAGGSAGVVCNAQLNKPAYIPAGLGLYFRYESTDSGHAGLMRSARWKLL